MARFLVFFLALIPVVSFAQPTIAQPTIEWMEISMDGTGSFQINGTGFGEAEPTVEIGDQSEHANCERRETLEVMEWTDESIVAFLNLDVFSQGEQAYLFVTDGQGEVSEGTEIVVPAVGPGPPVMGEFRIMN